MRKIILILAAITGLMTVSSCSKDKVTPETPTLSVSPENVQATAVAANYTVEITSNVVWTATSNETWCSVSPASGEGFNVLIFAVAENTAIATRTATVTIKAGDLTESVVVTQLGLTPVLSVDTTMIDAVPAAADYTVEITSNAAWTATSNETWCSVSPTSGSGSGVLTLAVAENTSIATRTATVTVKAGDLSEAVVITQSGVAPVLSVNATKIDAAPTAADYTIEITSNVAWTATSAETWCSVSPTSGSGSGVLTLAVAENTSIATRTATVTVKAGDLNCDIIVIQTSVHTAPAVVFTSDRQLITFLASAQKLIVNWGDGEISEYNNLRYGTYFSYSYLTATTHTIQIYEEKLTALNLSGLDLTNLDVNCSELTELYCSSNQLTSLDVSKNPKLTKIDCSSNQLTSLNINGCTKLGEIPYYYSVVSIDDNQLSAAALNEIFTALPVITSNNIISVGDNPGTSTCNKSIAINKGWRINDGY